MDGERPIDSPHTLFDACDGVLSCVAGQKDPSTFFLDMEDDGLDLMAPLMMDASQGNDVDDDLLIMGAGCLNPLNSSSPDPSVPPSGWMVGSFPPIPEHSELGQQDPMNKRREFEVFEVDLSKQKAAGLDDFRVSYTNASGSSSSSSLHQEADVHHKGVPRVASMPNFMFGDGKGPRVGGPAGGFPSELGLSPPSMPPKSFSTNDLAGMVTKYDVPHSQYLTAPHLRKGKGGRQPALDPRMDPNVDPKKARRILANRLSAAKSKMKQKSAMESLKLKVHELEMKKQNLDKQILMLKDQCTKEEARRARLDALLPNGKANIEEFRKHTETG